MKSVVKEETILLIFQYCAQLVEIFLKKSRKLRRKNCFIKFKTKTHNKKKKSNLLNKI